MFDNGQLREYLEKIYRKYGRKYSSKDPVWLIHEFGNELDAEIAAVITSCFAYGNVESINAFVKRIFGVTGENLREFTLNYSEQKDKKLFDGFVYRFNVAEDVSLLFANLRNCLLKHGSLGKMLTDGISDHDSDIIPALTRFSAELRRIQGKGNSYSYLLPDPLMRSACKRLNLLMRWMVRKDEIDLGFWSAAGKHRLIMPVDTHVYRVASLLGLASRKTCDLKFALELTDTLRRFDAGDPVRFDFALCHIGIDGSM